jgi:hypothetical protein
MRVFTHHKITHYVRYFILLAVLSSSILATTPQVTRANGNSSQVRFQTTQNIPGSGYVYFTDLQICGWNQDDHWGCWPNNNGLAHVSDSGIASYTVWNWWWKLDRGISFQFNLVGYGRRSCTISRSNYGNPNLLDVYYQGNNSCSFL